MIVFLTLLGFIGYYFSTIKDAPYTLSSKQYVVDYAIQNLPLEGTLMKNPDGFVYLKIDDRYVHTLYPMLGLKEEGFKQAPYFRRKNAPGAHISIFYKDEHINPKEIGQKFHFQPKKIVIVKAGNAKYALLQVDAPELEKLRSEYGKTSKLHGNEFHIAIAKKYL